MNGPDVVAALSCLVAAQALNLADGHVPAEQVPAAVARMRMTVEVIEEWATSGVVS